ncbi:MAG: 2'-5' RNA ligase family protein [Gemmatimonadetes bacterium]|nr:2'-5' RNA ligase family protein [Gemmatimonadota bacterium]
MSGIFITVELESALAGRIRAVQERWDPKLAKELPPHISIIGSSGAGPIAPDTPIAELRAAIEPVARSVAPLPLAFGMPYRFIGREIVVLPLSPHGALRALHERLKESGVRYEAARWPFTPHCTLNFYATLTPESLRALLRVREPETWMLHTLRVYHSRDNHPPKLLFDAPLGGEVVAPQA